MNDSNETSEGTITHDTSSSHYELFHNYYLSDLLRQASDYDEGSPQYHSSTPLADTNSDSIHIFFRSGDSSHISKMHNLTLALNCPEILGDV